MKPFRFTVLFLSSERSVIRSTHIYGQHYSRRLRRW